MRPVIIILVSLLWASPLWAACSGSTPTWTCTADSTAAQINTCIGSATAGDTINIGAGSGTWTTTVVITKGLHLKGAGADSTTITHGVTGDLLQVLPTDQTSNLEYEITGFTFASADKNLIRLGQANYQPTTFQTKVNIHHNVFGGQTSDNAANQYIWHHNMGGAVWKNTFVGRDQQIRSTGYGADDDIMWTLTPNVRGTINALFIEDNVFTMTTADPTTYIADGVSGCGSRVWRYNTFNYGSVQTGALIDWHGATTGSYHSCMGDEVYGNEVVPLTGGAFGGWAGARGSLSLIFYNSANTSGTVTNGSFCGQYGCDTFTNANLLLYEWVNAKQKTSVVVTDPSNACTTITCDGIADYAKLNWNAFQYYTTFDGTAGMGCGASLPSPSGYAERVGYWVTSQSCASVAGLVGDVVTNPTRGQITGDLYEIQSGAWVKIFTPYSYPHPVSASGGGGHTYAPWRTP
jgi:hypothetical protein